MEGQRGSIDVMDISMPAGTVIVQYSTVQVSHITSQLRVGYSELLVKMN